MMSVQADVTVEVNGDVAHLTSDGAALTLTAAHPERVWTSVMASALPAGVGQLDGPRAVGRIADQLVDAGLSLRVTGPSGTVVDMGYGIRSRVGRVVTGSSGVRPGGPRALAPMVSPRSWAVAGAILMVIVGGAAAVVRRVRA